MTDIRIRPAEQGDTRFLAWVILEAGRSHLPRGISDLLISDEQKRIDFLNAIVSAEEPSMFHYAGFLVAEIDGRQAAALTGYEPSIAEPVLDAVMDKAKDSVGFSEQDRAEYAYGWELYSRCHREASEDRWVVEFVATVPDLRGRGVVSQLLQAILDRGRERGYEKAQIEYLLGNDLARRVYERTGFKTVSQNRDPEFEAALGCPGAACMYRAL